MKLNTILSIIILFAILSGCCNKKTEKKIVPKPKSSIKVYIKKHSGDYKSVITRYDHPERPNSIIIFFDCIISNSTDSNISVISYGIVEKPYLGAIFQYNEPVNPNGLYDLNGNKIEMPINIEAGFSKRYILKAEVAPLPKVFNLIEEHFKKEKEFLMSSAESLLVSKHIALGFLAGQDYKEVVNDKKLKNFNPKKIDDLKQYLNAIETKPSVEPVPQTFILYLKTCDGEQYTFKYFYSFNNMDVCY